MRSRLPWLAFGALIGLAILGPMAALSGQTRMDQAVTRLSGQPFTENFDLDARADTLETATTALQAAAAKGRLVTVTVGAEAANVIALTVEVNDLLGVDAAGPVRTQLRLFTDPHFITAANPGLFPVTDGGDGSVEATNVAGAVSVICLTGPATRNQLAVTDSSGGSGATLYGYVDVLAGSTPIVAARVRFVVTFDGA